MTPGYNPLFVVRRARAGDELVLMMIRTLAMEEDPDAFNSTPQQEGKRSPEIRSRWVAPGGTFFLETDDGTRGFVTGHRDEEAREVVHLISMYVARAYRGTGAADALIERLVTWAAVVGAAEVRLHVARSNARAKRFYARNGFLPTGRTLVRERDGAIEIKMALSLDGAQWG